MGLKFTLLKNITFCATMFFTLNLNAQVTDVLRLSDVAISENAEKWGLNEKDLANYYMSDNYVSRHNQVTHIYMNQVANDILVENAIIGLNFNKEGKLLLGSSRFIADIDSKITETTANLNAETALQAALQVLNINADLPRLTEEKDFSLFVYEKGSIANLPINTQLLYARIGESLKLAWRTQIYGSKSVAVYIDANTGELLKEASLDVTCAFHKDMYHNHSSSCVNHALETVAEEVNESIDVDNSVYHVFPLPLESPNHGSRSILTNPADPIASPLGWHDTNGQEGPEFTITRGNNVHAFYDPEADEVPPTNEVDGGADLVFDFDYFSDQEPTAQINNTVTQLFYMNNMMHDIAYNFGFTEEAGNFQANNYGNGGQQGDYVVAFSQYGDGQAGTVNNATFATPGDGGSGQMRMFLWNSGSGIFQVTSPSSISAYYSVGTADFGPSVQDNPATGEVTLVDDGFDIGVDGCETIINASEVAGKIAMIDRGLCFFEQKTANAEEAGAIAVIICNFEDSAMGMTGTPDIPNPSIPTVSLSSTDCNLIKAALSSGPVTVKLEQPQGGLNFLPGSYDNGVMAHEYGHGISNRLTGGPSAAGCLGNEEQMGEGWSDFFSLITTVEPGDTGGDKRGIGTFATSEPVDGNGIRPYPYSTDMTINPMVYDNITTFSIPHGVGAVWCSMLWDMYWSFVDEYGYDEDVSNATAGNNMAIQLVMDGMKFQPCNPGFADGRDAILAADQELYNGDNQCLIWDVFARRGMGINSSQGSSDSRSDGEPNYESIPTCVAELKIKKEVTELIQPGDDVDVTLTITNHRPEDLTSVAVTDELPDGLTIDEASASIPATVSGNTVSFEIGDMAYLDEVVITYKLKSDPEVFSQRFYLEDLEDNSTVFNEWTASNSEGLTGGWELTTELAYSGAQSFKAADDGTVELKSELTSLVQHEIQGDRPVLRMYHYFNTVTAVNGGYIELSTNQGNTWQRVQDSWIKNGYNTGLSYTTFTVPFLEGFSGNSTNFIGSYLDLTDYIGETISLRFRYGAAAGSPSPVGWVVDDIELMDLITYNGEACVSSDQSETACASAEGEGTIVDSDISTNTKDAKNGLTFNVFPNPASDAINIQLNDQDASTINIELFDATGKLIQSISKANYGNSITTIPTAELAKGVYIVKVISNGFAGTQKVILN